MLSLGKIDDNFPNETHIEIRNNEEVFEPGYRLSAYTDKNTIGFGNDEVNADKPENKFNYEYGFIKDYNPEELAPNNEFDQKILGLDGRAKILSDAMESLETDYDDIAPSQEKIAALIQQQSLLQQQK